MTVNYSDLEEMCSLEMKLCRCLLSMMTATGPHMTLWKIHSTIKLRINEKHTPS